MAREKTDLREDDPLWYKDAVIYELHVKAFFDSSDDGIGDFRGLRSKLDYLSDLGVTAVWLLPFYPSPLRDDGYDIADYRAVHPDYGSMRDFREFLREAHRRGIRVITELVLNHTSDQHQWFRRSRTARPGSAWRDFYVWSDSPDRYGDTRIIFQDFEHSNWSWDPAAKAYFWHRFYSHQPDLNYENSRVKEAMFRTIDFWFGMGVDGLRLDAVPYLFEREGTNCENLPETHAMLRELRAHVDGRFRNRMFLAEANQWPEDAAAYFGQGDECHMNFHFPLMPRMFMAVQMEDSFPITDILEQTPSVHPSCQWALFLRNHDELTLEMVTDEERDYMYRVYAGDPRARINLGIRRRLAPLLGNNRRKMELMNILLLTLPGTPVIYYGDEIGMGDNYYLGDRDGVRTPMQWSPDRNAGFSRANPQQLYLPVIIDPEYHFEAVNVETQERNPSSLLWWMRRTLATRTRFKAFGRGTLRFLPSDNSKVLAYLREYGNERILVLVNLSRFSQVIHLDLSEFNGWLPEDVFSLLCFPPVKESAYAFMLGPHGYHLFQLRPTAEVQAAEEETVPSLVVKGSWEEAFSGRARDVLEKRVLPRYLVRVRWFGGKARTLRKVRIAAEMHLLAEGAAVRACLLEVIYTEGPAETYFLPVTGAGPEEARALREKSPQAIITEIEGTDGACLVDALFRREFQQILLDTVSRNSRLRGNGCEMAGYRGRALRRLTAGKDSLAPALLRAEQSNTSIVYGDTLILKLYRRLDEGVNPDLEVSRFLTEHSSFGHSAPYAGSLTLTAPGRGEVSLGQVQGYVPQAKDAWQYTLDSVGSFYERVLATREEPPAAAEAPGLLDPLEEDDLLEDLPADLREHTGTFYPEMAALLGQRTGELHIALTSVAGFPDFSPEPFSQLYQRSVYQSMRSLTRRTLNTLRRKLKGIPEESRGAAESVLSSEAGIIAVFDRLREKKLSAMKIRIHGDYHLGQVLFTGKDFVIIDFEGEPARPLSERRLRRSALRDVAGMIRSFHYAATGALLLHPSVRPEDVALLGPWAERWALFVSRLFLNAYLRRVRGFPFLPEERAEADLLLRAFLLEKAVYEVGYELNNRPSWLGIPLRGICRIMGLAE